MNANWGARILAYANATTESEHETVIVDGLTVESVKRGVKAVDWFAWVNGDRRVWVAGCDRQEAIEAAVWNAKRLAAPPRYPTIVVNHPEQHVIRNYGLRMDARESVLTIIGLPILHECLWPHLAYPTYRDRWIEHGEILRLTIWPPDSRHQRIDLVGVADLWNNYERITDLTGSRWVCRRADDVSQVPKMNLVAECPCKILFKDRNVDRSWANSYPLSESSVLPLWRPDASCPAIRSPAMNWPQQCGIGGVG